MSSIGELTAFLGVDTTGLRKANKEVDTFANRTKAAFRRLAPFVGIGAGILAFRTLTMEAVRFEDQMASVLALTSATEAEFVQLNDTAEMLGRTTRFSAAEAADGMNFLAMAGFEVNEIIGAMPNVLQLASAASIDLGRAADITTNIMTGYGKTADELADVNDVLVKAFTSANINLSQLGQAMKFVGPVARSAGVEFEEVSATIGLLGNVGLQGTLAGTALRNAISRLINPSKEAEKSIAALGLEVIDSKGKFVGVSEVVGQFEEAFKDVGGEAQRTAVLMEIFGQRAGPAMAALIEEGSESIREFTERLKDSEGIAERISEEKLKTLSGRFLLLKSAVTGVAIDISQDLNPSLKGFVDTLTASVPVLVDFWNTLTSGPKAFFDQMERANKEFESLNSSINTFKEEGMIDPLDLSDPEAWAMWGKNIFTTVSFIFKSIGRTFAFVFQEASNQAKTFGASLAEIGTIIEGAITFDTAKIKEGWEALQEVGNVSLDNLEKNLNLFTGGILGDFDEMIAKMKKRMEGASDDLPPIEIKVEPPKTDINELISRFTIEITKDIEEINASFASMREEAELLEASLLTPLQQYEIAMERLNTLVDHGAISWETYRLAGDRALEALEGDSVSFYDSLQQGITSWGSQFSSSMAQMLIDGTVVFEDLAASFAKMILTMMRHAQLVAPFVASLFGGGTAGTTTVSNAKGNTFSGGSIVPFASGGVVNSPTLFPMANGTGLMGEAGPEAILPLSRLPNGSLGVSADLGAASVAGGGTIVNVTVINNTSSDVSIEEAPNASGGTDLSVVIDEIVAGNVRNGKTGRAISDRFGLSPRRAGR